MNCRSCGVEVVWVVTEAGKKMPVDAKPTEKGNLLLENGVARYVEAGKGTHVSHFATCAQAKGWRKGK